MDYRTLRFGFLAVSLCAVATAPLVSYAYSYFVDEPRYYGAGDCGGTSDMDRPDRTYPIRNGLQSLGWTGVYYTGSSAWPQDFLDATWASDGLDATYADAHELAVFSGHGNSGYIFFSNSHKGRCGAGGSGQHNGVALGYAKGDKAAAAVVISCCYLNPNTLAGVMDNGTTQIMGYGSVSSTDAGMVSNFFNDTQSRSNMDAWLDDMEDKPGWFTGDNTSAVFTRGWNASDAAWNVANCKLKGGTCWAGWVYGPGNYWRLDYKDHGCSGCNGC